MCANERERGRDELAGIDIKKTNFLFSCGEIGKEEIDYPNADEGGTGDDNQK